MECRFQLSPVTHGSEYGKLEGGEFCGTAAAYGDRSAAEEWRRFVLLRRLVVRQPGLK